MKFLRVKNWEQYQNPSTPKYIRQYVDLLDPTKHPTFAKLSDGAKLTLHHLRMLAGKCANKIPETWLNKDRLNMQTKPKVDELFSSQFIEYDNGFDMPKPLSSFTRASGVSDSSASSLINQELEFEALWRDILSAKVPMPVHKSLAHKRFFSSVVTPEDMSRLNLALANYRRSERVARNFVQDASTWLGNWRDWIEALPPPPAPRLGPDGLAIATPDAEYVAAEAAASLAAAAVVMSEIDDPSSPTSKFNTYTWPEMDEAVLSEAGDTRWEKWVSFCAKRGMSPTRKTA